jgi:tetratricopeptide (TPR) repeat protein
MFRRERKSGSANRTSQEIAQYTQGMLKYRRGEYQIAADMLNALTDHPGPIGKTATYYGAMANRAIGLEAMRTSDFCEAERCFRDATRAIGRRANLTEYLAACYAKNQKFDRCVAEMEKSAQDGQAAQWRKLAQAQWRGGMKVDAMMSLHEACRIFGDNSEIQLQLGLFCAAEEQFDKAFTHLSSAVKNDCDNPRIHYYLALVASAQGDTVQALRHFQRSFDLEPTDMLVARQLSMTANTLQQAGVRVVLRLPESRSEQESSAARQLARYLTQDSDISEAMLKLPESEVDNDLFGVLASVLDIALDEHNDYADLHYYASCTYQRLGDGKRALEHARAALDINPKYVKARMQMSHICEQNAQPAQAAEHTVRAIEYGADWPDVHLHAAELLAECKRNERAKQHLLRALELKPDYTQASDALVAIGA